MERFSAGIPSPAILLLAVLIAVLPGVAVAQEVLLSDDALYLDFLALDGQTAPPSLTYRTLSDARFGAISGDHPWERRFSKPVFRGVGGGKVSFRIYGPELYSSFNTAYPHGVNDGALWQGVGLNASLSAGVRLEAWGFEATFKPVLSWMQNRDFDIMPGVFGSPYSYFWNKGGGLDVYQRPGPDALWDFDFGDSELRYSYGPVTAGFGTQSIWLGPARINPIIMSNNAKPFPKFDIGLRRLATPAGDIEARLFIGRLDESGYWVDDLDGDWNQITGLALAYAPSFLPGLSVSLNRTVLSNPTASGLGFFDWGSLATVLYPWFTDDIAEDERDQRASVSIDYRIPKAGFDIYLEWARNDFSPSLDAFIRYPFHSQAYTIGLRKSVSLFSKRVRGEILIELSTLESSRDTELIGPTTFYAHWKVPEGYTNRGQILGAAAGTGGNSQYLGARLYHAKGFAEAYIHRINRDNDYVYFLHFGWPQGGGSNYKRADEYKINAELTFGLRGSWFFTDALSAKLGLAYCMNHNPLYTRQPGGVSFHLNNIHIQCGVSLRI